MIVASRVEHTLSKAEILKLISIRSISAAAPGGSNSRPAAISASRQRI